MELLTVTKSTDLDNIKVGEHFIYKGREYSFSSYSGTIAQDYEIIKVFNMKHKLINLTLRWEKIADNQSSELGNEDYKLDGEYIQEQKDSHGLEGYIPDLPDEIWDEN